MSKNINILISILIVFTITIFALSFYVDWIDNYYSEILFTQFVILMAAKFIDWRAKK